MSRSSANCLLLLTAMIWGCAFVAQATAMAKMGPILFTGLRFLIAAAVVLPFAIREGGGRLLPESAPAKAEGTAWPLPTALLSLVFLCGQITQQFGVMGTSVTNAGFLTALYVILVPIFGILLFRSWPHRIVWPCALTAVGGTWLLGGGLDGLRMGDLLVMVSAVFWALQVVILGSVVRQTGRPLFAVFAQSLTGGLVAFAVALALEPVSLEAVLSAAPELAVAGALSGGLAFSMQAIGQRYTGASDAAVIFSSEAIFAALAAAVLLGERLAPAGWVGCALILAGVIAVQLVPLIRRRNEQAVQPAFSRRSV